MNELNKTLLNLADVLRLAHGLKDYNPKSRPIDPVPITHCSYTFNLSAAGDIAEVDLSKDQINHIFMSNFTALTD